MMTRTIPDTSRTPGSMFGNKARKKLRVCPWHYCMVLTIGISVMNFLLLTSSGLSQYNDAIHTTAWSPIVERQRDNETTRQLRCSTHPIKTNWDPWRAKRLHLCRIFSRLSQNPNRWETTRQLRCWNLSQVKEKHPARRCKPLARWQYMTHFFSINKTCKPTKKRWPSPRILRWHQLEKPVSTFLSLKSSACTRTFDCACQEPPWLLYTWKSVISVMVTAPI